MACSKIFSGDLPELFNEIIQYFRNDFSTLHSCILVNRLWCRLAIPLSWEDPFSMKLPINYHFIEIYLHNFNESGETKLNEYGINNSVFPSNTLFNYPCFIKCLTIKEIMLSIEDWIKFVTRSSRSSNSNFNQIFRLIYRSLLEKFIENEVNLHTFEFDGYEYYSNVTLELILQNPNFIHNIRNLKLNLSYISSEITILLKFLHSNCNLISTISFQFIGNENDHNEVLQIINSQQNLKKISFER